MRLWVAVLTTLHAYNPDEHHCWLTQSQLDSGVYIGKVAATRLESCSSLDSLF